MFGLFSSKLSQMRQSAANWLEVADKVWHFRRDVLNAKESAELRGETAKLRQQLSAKATADQLKLTIDALEGVLRRTGGAIYPKSALVENVEFFLVAAIVIIGVKSYFLQPFKIPTNSMWPTYYGMTPEVFPTKSEEPNAAIAAARGLFLGAWPHRLDAPVDGEVLIPVSRRQQNRNLIDCRIVPGRTWLVIPTYVREYTIFVGDRPVTVKLPMDFDFEWVVSSAFVPGLDLKDFARYVNDKIEAGAFEIREIGGVPIRCIRTGRYVKAGERVLSFDELTGDMLFVDRLTYNFVRPKVGQGFVFATRNIPLISQDQYYIKRLIGVPGDTIQIREPMIYRNGSPITGAAAFDKNARREAPYRGYFNGPANEARYLLTPDEKLPVPEKSYFAMGDNSGFSSDGRYWGFVPAKEVVGRPLFIYYPFTKRWGPTR